MPHTANKNYLLLDSCIAEYLLDKHIHESITKQLEAWAGSSFDLAISEISYAELIDGAVKNKVTRVKELLNNYTRFEVTERVLSGAGILSTIYKTQNSKTNGAGMQDKIIASTAFIYNLPVVTADVHDYPHPFFTSIESENLQYRKKNKDNFIVVDILKPNTQILQYWYTKAQ